MLSRIEEIRREQLAAKLEGFGVDVDEILDRIDDFKHFRHFKYMALREALVQADVEVNDLPMQADLAEDNDIIRMETRWNSVFLERINTGKLFEGCSDVREKIARCCEMNDVQLQTVIESASTPVMVKNAAEMIWHMESTKELSEILNQSYGKPLEKTVSITGRFDTPPNIAQLNTDEIKRLLGKPVEEEAEYEVIEDGS